jgi:hypothetical protein
MPEGISPAEARIVQELVGRNVAYNDALAAVVLLTRAYSRPPGDLAETLRHYPGLEDLATVNRALAQLETRRWLTRETTYGVEILGPAANLRELVAELCQDSSLAKRLLELRRVNDDYVTLVGPLRDKEAFVSYLSILRTAQSHIYMPIIATAPEGLESVPILIERARAGVDVRILAATPGLAANVRGEQLRAIAKERIRAWSTIANKEKNLKLRLTGEAHDLLLATSLCIDGRILRLVVYDFLKERSKEGVLVEFSSFDGKPLNIIQFAEEAFRSAWAAAKPLGLLRLAVWHMKRFWHFPVAALFALLAYLPYVLLGKDGFWRTNDNFVSLLTAVFSSVAAAFLFTGMVEIGPRLKAKRSARTVK